MPRFLVAAIGIESLILEGLKRVFSRSPFRLTRTSSTLDEFFAEAPPDCEKLDFLLLNAAPVPPRADECIQRMREAYPGARLVILAQSRTDCGAALAHSDGLILARSPAAVIVKTLELIALGERIFPVRQADVSTTRRPFQQSDVARAHLAKFEPLSTREAEVFRHLAEGCPNKVIARQLGLAEATVKMHVKSILRKTGARNRTEAALLSVGPGGDPGMAN